MRRTTVNPALALFVLSLMQQTPALSADYNATVVSVPDGDSLNVQHGMQKERIILFGIDCPEIGQEYGQEARNFTDKSCYKKSVGISVSGTDAKGRVIAVVTLPDGTNLNQELVKQGLAWWSDKYAPNDTVLKQLQATARAGHIGLWSAAKKPVAPWLFRNGEKDVNAQIMPKN